MKTLILYYSYGGNTKRIAEMIQKEIGGDIVRMDTVVPYDGDYDTADYYTTEEVYNSCEVGDMFSYDENRDCEEEPVEKSK